MAMSGSEAYAGGDWLQPPHTEACGWCRSPPAPCDCGLESMVGEIHRLQAVVKRLEKWRDSPEQAARQQMVLEVIRAKREAGAPRDAAFFTAVWPAALAALKRERAAVPADISAHVLQVFISTARSVGGGLYGDQFVREVADAVEAQTARLAEAERLLRDALDAVPWWDDSVRAGEIGNRIGLFFTRPTDSAPDREAVSHEP